MTETWKPIPGYEGWYEISSQGRVRARERQIWHGANRWGKGFWRTRAARLIKPSLTRRYYRVTLQREGRREQLAVHRLVLAAFIGPCPPGMEGCHADDDPSNNHLSNLRWDTTSANVLDQVRNGNHGNARKTHCKRGHGFTPENTYQLPSTAPLPHLPARGEPKAKEGSGMTGSDISETLIPNSDQLDAEDLAASGPRVFTVTRTVVKSGAEQPVDVYFAEFPRPWRPGRNMRRVLAHCWGKDSSKWVDHKVELYCDPDVKFGKETVGGTRISRLSHINGPVSAPIIIGRGTRGKWPVKPLAEVKPTPPAAPSFDGLDADALRAMWKTASPEVRKAIEARVAELAATETGEVS